MKILILCTGNSCRSQMAEAFLQYYYPKWEVYSAGTHPSKEVHPLAVRVMQEKGIDISDRQAKNVDLFITQDFDFVITVCDHAKATCPIFNGTLKKQIHIGFEDPAEAKGTDDFVFQEFRRIRDQIEKIFKNFTANSISST